MEELTEDDKLFVNGPINAVRLEGKINGMHKTLYVFFDIHLSVGTQTQCPSYSSVDFVNYFVKTIKKTDKAIHYDLFFEVGSSLSYHVPLRYRGRYIDEIYKYFKSTINVTTDDKTKKIAKNIGSKHNSNLRLHYIDIRDNLKKQINNALNILYQILADSFTNFSRMMYDKQQVKQQLNVISLNIKKIISELEGKKINKKRSDDTTSYILNKIMHKYHYSDIKKILLETSFFITKIHNLAESIQLNIDNMHNAIKQYEETYTDPNILSFMPDGRFTYGADSHTFLPLMTLMKIYLNAIDDETMVLYSSIVDLYFIRRFLDKDYVNHGIVYTGASHSTAYICCLVKYFNFNITHSSYLKVHHSEAEQIIHKHKFDKKNFGKNIDELFYPPILSQCVDMTHFPDKFL